MKFVRFFLKPFSSTKKYAKIENNEAEGQASLAGFPDKSRQLRTAGKVAFLLLMLGFMLSQAHPAQAEGSRDLYPNGTSGYRANLEWRTSSYGGNLTRRTLLKVYAKAGEFIFLGSSAMDVSSAPAPNNSPNLGDISVYFPGQITGAFGTEVFPANPSFRCSDQRNSVAISPNFQGQIVSRSQELAGPDTIPGGGVVGGYTPCYYQAPITGIFDVAFYGPSGGTVDTENPSGLGGLANDAAFPNSDSRQNTSVAMWDVTVRDSLTSITDKKGRLFAYYLALYPGGNNKPLTSVVQAISSDGYRYKVDFNGLDPNGFVLYANQVGYLDSDGVTPLYHDVLADRTITAQQQNQLFKLQGGVSLAPPKYPIFFSVNPLEKELTDALAIPPTPILPVVTNYSFVGKILGGGVALFGKGGTFGYKSNIGGVYEIVISRDGLNFDATNPLNRVLRGVRPAGNQFVDWDGKDNGGRQFPVGTGYKAQVNIHAGEYHFPLLDAENSTRGGPSYTLLNPPGGKCPLAAGCSGAFYDDRGYFTIGGTEVWFVNQALCGENGPLVPFSGFAGYDTTTSQRAYGQNTLSNGNTVCDGPGYDGKGAFGDKKGLDLWTYTPSNNENIVITIVAKAADIQIIKTVNNPAPRVGQNVIYTIAANNLGPDDATGVQVTDNLPSGLTYLSSAVSAGTYDPATGIWQIGNLALNSTATLQITARVNQTGNVVNIARKTGEDQYDPNGGNDPNAGNNFGTTTINVPQDDPPAPTATPIRDSLPSPSPRISPTVAAGNPTPTPSVPPGGATNTPGTGGTNPTPGPGEGAEPGISKVSDTDTAAAGQTVKFTITVTNSGSTAVNGVSFSDDVPGPFAIQGVTSSQGASEVSGQKVTVDLGTIGPGGSVTIVITTVVKAGSVGPYTNNGVLSTGRRATATVTLVPGLPNTGRELTGETPWLWLGLGLALLGSGLYLVYRGRRFNRPQR